MDILLGDPTIFLALLGVAFLAGLVDAIAGGGGLITIPALLTAGIPPHLALGTNKLAGTFGTFSAARAYIRRGLIHPRHWMAGITATLLGAAAGTMAVLRVPSEHLHKILPILIFVTALYMLAPRQRRLLPQEAEIIPARRSSIPLGWMLGFYDGFAGPGTGAFWTTAAMAVYRADLVRASGIARTMNFVSNLVSLFTFAIMSSVDYLLGLALGLALMTGAHIGAHSAIRYGAPFIRPVFILVVLATSLRLAWTEWMV